MSAAEGAVLDRPDVADQDATERPPIFHYVKKTAILSSVVEGGLVQALCGEVFPVTRTPPPGAPVCPACIEIYEGLKA